MRECIVLRDADIRSHACCLNAVIGWNAVIGEWARVEGTSNDPNPNKKFNRIDVVPVFNSQGQLNPSITVIGTFIGHSSMSFFYHEISQVLTFYFFDIILLSIL